MSDDPDGLDHFLREELPRILKLVQFSRVRELELGSDSAQLIIHRAETDGVELPAEMVSKWSLEGPESSGPHTRTVSAPTVGVFYHSEQPGRAALVEPGSRIERGSLIGVIEALQVLTEVESDATGTVQRVVAEDGQPVEFGQPLVEVMVDE